MIAYLDRNVLSHLRQRTSGSSAQDELTLRAAIKRGDLVLPLSVVTLSETLLMGDMKRALDEVRWIIGLTGRSHIVDDAVPLVNDCLWAYAHDTTPPSPYVTLDLERVTSPTPRDKGEIKKAMLVYKHQRTTWADVWTRWLETWKEDAHLTFNKFLSKHAVEWLQTMVKDARVRSGCERRGWDGLLTRKTVRLGVVVPFVLAHAKILGDRELEEAHFGDLHHAITATCADVFVTHDAPLRSLIHRAHVPGLEVLTLPQLARRLMVGTEPGT